MLPTPRDTSEEVAQEAARVVSRLSTLSPARVPVDVVRPAAQRLADLARRAEGLEPLPVPDLAPHGWVDLLRLVVGELLSAASGGAATAPRSSATAAGPSPRSAPAGGASSGSAPQEALLVEARDVLTHLRRALP